MRRALTLEALEAEVEPERDPRTDPRQGDRLDDDPPLPPLEVMDASYGDVSAVRRRNPRGPTYGVWQGTLEAWRREMVTADVLSRRRR